MGLSNAERQAAFRKRREAELAKLRKGGDHTTADKQRISELEREVARLRAKLASARPSGGKHEGLWTRSQLALLHKCLQPDARRNATEAMLDEAARMLNDAKDVLLQPDAARVAAEWKAKQDAAYAAGKAQYEKRQAAARKGQETKRRNTEAKGGGV